MPRPTTKDELLQLGQSNFKKLLAYVNSFSASEQLFEFPKGTLNRNVKDVLAHLHHWHLMLLDWYKVGMQGQKPEMPAPGYTWKTVPKLNKVIWKKYRDHDLEDVKKKLQSSHDHVINVIKKHSDKELFEKKRYPWTGSTSLGAYLISATSSHYDWAYKLIKKVKKTTTS